jgi:AcrR family transcriptional regulator
MAGRPPSRRGSRRLDVALVTASAMSVVDQHGFDALSLSAVAEALGVGPSALYRHVDGLDGLRETVAVESTRLLTEAVRNAAIGTAGDDALHAVAAAYRCYAEENPGHFAAIIAVRSTGPTMDAARTELESVFALLYRARGVAEPTAGVNARNARSAIHGFVVLQHTGGGATTVDGDYRALVDGLCRVHDS